MVVETELIPFWQWLLHGTDEHIAALWWFLLIAVGLSLLGGLVGFFVAAVRHGPIAAGEMTYRVITTGIGELFLLSRRRVWALARLAIQESIRRKVLVALVVYVVILGFASWFLSTDSSDPVNLYVSFVLNATNYLVLLIALFLSAFSLPNDIKNRTIYTIVTKPVRAGEIVLGRIIGFSAVGTLLLVAMGLMGYFFVARSLNHTHEISELDLVEVQDEGGQAIGKKGQTSRSLHHRHEVVLESGQTAHQTETRLGHWHEVTSSTDASGQVHYEVSQPHDMFQARVPVYGKLRFRDASGKEVARGISVGNEWAYRSFIEGASAAAAIWTFSDITEDKYPEGLPLEMYVRVFRSHKGNIEEGILGSIVLKNPETGLTSDIQTFRAKDFYIDERFIPRELTDAKGNSIDLFRDLVHDGKVEIWIQCMARGQYFGAAQADCYIRAADGRFDLNMLKGYVGIWVQMIMVICIGVMFSTFLSGPIAMIATIGCIVLGFFAEFILDVALGHIEGGGPVESFIRMVTQRNVTEELEQSLGTTVAQTLDKVLMFFMQSAANLLPNFQKYSKIDFVAAGFNIPSGEVAKDLIACAGFVVGVVVAGYFFLRLREVAK